jgi:NAD(P)-dependent dehydrogenase (short-subunit alcohol dehydrogenase family)
MEVDSTALSKRFANQVALVIGGAQGIGRAIVSGWRSRGADVVIADMIGR